MARTLFRAGKLGARKPRPIERSVHELRRHIAVASREHTRCLMAGNYVGADMWLYIRNSANRALSEKVQGRGGTWVGDSQVFEDQVQELADVRQHGQVAR